MIPDCCAPSCRPTRVDATEGLLVEARQPNDVTEVIGFNDREHGRIASAAGVRRHERLRQIRRGRIRTVDGHRARAGTPHDQGVSGSILHIADVHGRTSRIGRPDHDIAVVRVKRQRRTTTRSLSRSEDIAFQIHATICTNREA